MKIVFYFEGASAGMMMNGHWIPILSRCNQSFTSWDTEDEVKKYTAEAKALMKVLIDRGLNSHVRLTDFVR